METQRLNIWCPDSPAVIIPFRWNKFNCIYGAKNKHNKDKSIPLSASGVKMFEITLSDTQNFPRK
jgi:hypothetical protein